MLFHSFELIIGFLFLRAACWKLPEQVLDKNRHVDVDAAFFFCAVVLIVTGLG